MPARMAGEDLAAVALAVGHLSNGGNTYLYNRIDMAIFGGKPRSCAMSDEPPPEPLEERWFRRYRRGHRFWLRLWYRFWWGPE